MKLDQHPVFNPIVLEKQFILNPGENFQTDASKLRLELPAADLGKASIHVTAHEPGEEIHIKITPILSNGTTVCDYTCHSVPVSQQPDKTIDGTRTYLEAYERKSCKFCVNFLEEYLNS
jgi:hypothetical protein